MFGFLRKRKQRKKKETKWKIKYRLTLGKLFLYVFLTHFTLFFFSGRTRMQSWGT